MGDRLDFSFQVIETTVRVLYADITRLDVDALVSTDDVHLAPLGSVLVTSAVRLSAKYIGRSGRRYAISEPPTPCVL
jgi:hypothetical protein